MVKVIKKILPILISVMLIFSIPICSEASTLDDIITSGNDFLSQSSSSTVGTPDESKLKDISATVSGILLTIAIVVTVISTVVMGINFVIQSVEEKAKIKESMVPWIIGIIISFGAYGIWKVTMGIFYQIA